MSGDCIFCHAPGDIPAQPFGRISAWLCHGCAADPGVRLLNRRVEGEPGSLADGLAALHGLAALQAEESEDLADDGL